MSEKNHLPLGQRGSGSMIAVLALGSLAAVSIVALVTTSVSRHRATSRQEAVQIAARSNSIAAEVLQALLRNYTIYQRVSYNQPIRWLANQSAGVGTDFRWSFNNVGAPTSFDVTMCDPRSHFPNFAKGVFPNTGDCLAIATGGLLPGLEFSRVINNFDDPVPRTYFLEVTSRSGVQVAANNASSQVMGSNRMRIAMPPPMPVMSISASVPEITEGATVTITIDYDAGATEATFTASDYRGTPWGGPHTFTRAELVAAGGRITFNVKPTGLSGVTSANLQYCASVENGDFQGTPRGTVVGCAPLLVYTCRFAKPGFREPLTLTNGDTISFGINANKPSATPWCQGWSFPPYITSMKTYDGGWDPIFNVYCADPAFPNGECNIVQYHRCVNPMYMIRIDDLTSSSCTAQEVWIRWVGCFSPETKIRMADGSEKRADKMKMGDVVLNPVTGKSSKVLRVIIGKENKPLIELSVGNRRLRVTEKHPFLTAEGIKIARDLSPGEMIKVEGDVFSRIDSLRRPRLDADQKVWNFQLDEDVTDRSAHWLLSDGIVSGDLVLQESLEKESGEEGVEP